MKKIIALILVSILCLGMLASCGKDAGLDAAANYLDEIYEKKTVGGNDYDVVAKVTIEGTAYSVSWTVDNSAISIKESTKTGFYTVDLPDVNEAEAKYTLTATISNDKGKTVTKSYTYTLPVINSTGITSEPVEGTAYKLYMNHVNLSKKLFALNTDQQDHKYIDTTDDATKAADFYVEKVDGGYKWYTEINGVKNYVLAQGVKKDDGKISKYIGFSTSNATVFNYVQNTNSWQTTIDGVKYVVGTYGTYNTICISESSYITAENTGVSQFVVEFMTSSYAETLKPSDDKVTLTTPEEIVNAVYALEPGKILGQYTLTGVITSVDTEYSSQYSNVTVTIVVNNMTDKPVQCFRLKGTGADQIKVGDEITVTGNLMKYASYNDDGTLKFSKVEFDAGCTLDAVKGGTGSGSTGSGTTVDPIVASDNAVIIADYADANSWANGTQYTTITLVNGATVTAAGDNTNVDPNTGKPYATNTGKYYTNGENWRIYQTETPSVVITAAEGKTIATVRITYNIKNTGTLTLNGNNVASGEVVTVNAASITFSVGNTGTATNGQAQITAIEVIYAD